MKAAIIGLLAVVGLAGCTSVVRNEDGTFDVPRKPENVTVWGPAQSAMRIDNCSEEVAHLFKANEYFKCKTIVPYQFASAPGPGAQVVGSMIMGLGFGLGLAHSGNSQHNQTDIRASTVNPPVPGKK